MLSYFTILKTHYIIIPSYFTISPHPKTLFLLKYYFLIFLYYYFPTITFFQIPTAPPSPITTPPPPHHTTPHPHLYGSTIINHHTTTSTAPPASITTPPPKCFSLTALASHHTHYTIRKPKPISTGP